MFIPLYDAVKFTHIKRQYVTLALIAANVLVYLLTVGGGEDTLQAAAFGFGYVPAVAHDAMTLPPQILAMPREVTYLTYAFLHTDILHLGGNMLFLWVFGDNVEDALGHARYLVFYLACAAAGAFAHGVIAPYSQFPLIGASGAIAGIVAAYLILHPKVKIWILVLMRIPLRIPAYIVLVFWIGLQFFMFAMGGEEQVSWACHIGGIVTGAILVFPFRRRDVPLLDRQLVTPRAARVEQESAMQPIEGKPPPRWGRQ